VHQFSYRIRKSGRWYNGDGGECAFLGNEICQRVHLLTSLLGCEPDARRHLETVIEPVDGTLDDSVQNRRTGMNRIGEVRLQVLVDRCRFADER